MGTMVLMDWRSYRGLILASVIIFFNLGSKDAATGFPTRYTSSPTRPHFSLHEQAKNLGSGLEVSMELEKGE